ncbi:MAG: HAD-IA family hydrolase [Oscillospiraceae bacterium]
MTKIKALIFDLDGTLANTLESIAYFANNALKNAGLNIIEQDRYRYLVGSGAKYLVEQMFIEIEQDITNPETNKKFEKVLKEYIDKYDEDFMYLTKPYDGLKKMLDRMKSIGVKLGVLTNKPHQTAVKVINELYPNTFDKIYGKKDGFPLKPNKAALEYIMKDLGVNNDECFYIGDTKIDMITGSDGNVFTIGVLWGFRDYDELNENGADIVINEPYEIEKAFFEEEIQMGKYKHYKGNKYEVITIATDSETLDSKVVYKQLYANNDVFVRDAKMFCENVSIDGKEEKRFKKIK